MDIDDYNSILNDYKNLDFYKINNYKVIKIQSYPNIQNNLNILENNYKQCAHVPLFYLGVCFYVGGMEVGLT